MSSSHVLKVDSKGRIIIPADFRRFLRLKQDSQLLANLDGENACLIITPASDKQLLFMKIGISDKPGSLARIANLLAQEGVDLVSTESRSVTRGNNAEWRIFCNADSVKDLQEIKKKALSHGATSFKSKKISGKKVGNL